jgi:hypothetical protein
MTELWKFMKGVLDSQRTESYTRVAGLSTLYFYLMWATYKISAGVAIKDVDIPPVLAGFLFALYGFGEWIKTQKGGANGNANDQQTTSN